MPRHPQLNLFETAVPLTVCILNVCVCVWQWSLRNVFVSAVSKEVKRGEVGVHGEQVKTEQHHQHLDDDPDQSCTGTQSKHLWTESETDTKSLSRREA